MAKCFKYTGVKYVMDTTTGKFEAQKGFPITYDIKDDGEITINKGGAGITLTRDELQNIISTYNREIFFSEDVLQEVGSLEGECLPIGASDNKEYLAAVLNEYTQLREDNDGDGDGMSWRGCMDMAISRVDYTDYTS